MFSFFILFSRSSCRKEPWKKETNAYTERAHELWSLLCLRVLLERTTCCYVPFNISRKQLCNYI